MLIRIQELIRNTHIWLLHSFQDRRNRKSRSTSLEIDSMKEISGPADSENKAGDTESHVSETSHA
jgi:hypothetical protein